MKIISRFSLYKKALVELGTRQIGLYVLYRICLKTKVFLVTDKLKGFVINLSNRLIQPYRLFHDLPAAEDVISVGGEREWTKLMQEADEIVHGKIRLFGGEPIPLDLVPGGKLCHWTKYMDGGSGMKARSATEDIKFTWEPARFGWAFRLARAYHLFGNEDYIEAFWRYFDLFQLTNPANTGPNWISAQEVALRILAFSFAIHVFDDSICTTLDRKNKITVAIAEHADRILTTLVYARAQNNNHLLSEAAGLITASKILPEHPKSGTWKKIGWKWFERGLINQISDDGSYIQQSTSYHRLMLHLVLWINMLSESEQDSIPLWNNEIIRQKIKRSVQWLLTLCDPETGRVPNLGPNDGANILPLTNMPDWDYRPVLQAASLLFLNQSAFKPGSWDEMRIWLGACRDDNHLRPGYAVEKGGTDAHLGHPAVIHMGDSWAFLRAAQLPGRPGHADQLHLDLWWRGLNIAQDAGSYLYNGEPPWDNALTHTSVHNTVMVDGQEQMTRAGRFLYIDKAQAKVLQKKKAVDGSRILVDAVHDGYKQLGLFHNRRVTAYDKGEWKVEDSLTAVNTRDSEITHEIRLHWLLPDWEWKAEQIDNSEWKVKFLSPYGWIDLAVKFIEGKLENEVNRPIQRVRGQSSVLELQIARCGELILGSGNVSPIMGWVSPTYGLKLPALSMSFLTSGNPPVVLVSGWLFPEGKRQASGLQDTVIDPKLTINQI